MIDHLLQISEDMTGRLLNVFHDFASSNYSFPEDYVTQQERTENDKHYKARHKTQTESRKGQVKRIFKPITNCPIGCQPTPHLITYYM